MGECTRKIVSNGYLPRFYLRGLIDESGHPRRTAIRAAIRHFTSAYYSPWPFARALAVVMHEARIELAMARDALARRDFDKTAAAIRHERAELFAKQHGYDVTTLETVLAFRNPFGASAFNYSDDDRALVRAAIAIARVRKASRKRVSA